MATAAAVEDVAVVAAEVSAAVRLRSARSEEAQAITQLALRSKAVWGYGQAFMDACVQEMTVTGEQIAQCQGRIVVAERDEELLGYYALTAIVDGECELDALFVDPDYLGQGVGGLLLKHAISAAQDRGAEHIFIQADPFADGFYQRAGAQKIGQQESGSIPGRFLPLYQISLNSHNLTASPVDNVSG